MAKKRAAKKPPSPSRERLVRQLRKERANNDRLQNIRETITQQLDNYHTQYRREQHARTELAKQLEQAHKDLKAAKEDSLKPQIQQYQVAFRAANLRLATECYPTIGVCGNALPGGLTLRIQSRLIVSLGMQVLLDWLRACPRDGDMERDTAMVKWLGAEAVVKDALRSLDTNQGA